MPDIPVKGARLVRKNDVLKQQHVRSEGGGVRVGSEETRGKERGGVVTETERWKREREKDR